MRILIVGGSGMLGHKLYQSLSESFETYVTFRRIDQALKDVAGFRKESVVVDIDAFEFARIHDLFHRLRPDVVVNCVGIVKQLQEAKNRRLSIYVNALFPQLLADLSDEVGAKLIQVSTDCVFSGKRGGYLETDEPDAIDVYGRTKILGEVVEKPHLTLRTSIIGHELTSHHSLVDWFLSQNHATVRGYVNAIYTGLTTIELGRQIREIITQHPRLSGCLHISSERINKFELLNLIKKAYSLDIDLQSYAEFVCDRSLDSTTYSHITGYVAPPWSQMIQEMHDDPTNYQWKNNL